MPRPSATPSDPDEIAKQAHEHAWAWFALHANQRMQAFNFFFVATAFLVAAYGAILEKDPAAAAVLAVVGAWLAFWFTRIDARTHQLVNAARDALKVSQARLASLAGNSHLEIVNATRHPRRGTVTYRFAIGMIQWSAIVLFLLGAFYAIRLSLK